jgi:PAS domain S-box-containing protein
MFEASAVGIAVLDQQHHFAATNEALQKMVGYSGEELQSLGPLDIAHQDDREGIQTLIEDVLNGKRQDLPTETRYRRKDNKVIWVRVSAAQNRRSILSRRNARAILPAYSHTDNFVSPVVRNENGRTVPDAILREFLGNNNGMRRGVIGRRKNRSRFVRIPAAVVNVEIKPASFTRNLCLR